MEEEEEIFHKCTGLRAKGLAIHKVPPVYYLTLADWTEEEEDFEIQT